MSKPAIGSTSISSGRTEPGGFRYLPAADKIRHESFQLAYVQPQTGKYTDSLVSSQANHSQLDLAGHMLTELYIEALLFDEELADQVWAAWDKREIDDQAAWLA